MTFANPLPWWAIVLLVAAAAAVARLAYWQTSLSVRRRALLSAIRFVTLLLIVLLLMRPVARSRGADATDAAVVFLVDTSRSMGIEDAEGGRRIDRARQLLVSELLPAVSDRFQTEVLGFGAGLVAVTPGELSASAPRSDLTSALQAVRERYRGRALAGVILLSDGGDTSASERTAVDAGAPVFPIGIGTRTVGRDREVLSLTAAEAVLDDSSVELAVSAVSHGGSGAIELRLLENGRPLEVRRSAAAVDGTPVREVFHVTPNQGAATVYTVDIPAAAAELVPENNARSVLVQAPSRPRRVLVVQGAPGFEHSFLRRAWNGDRGLEVDSVVRKGKNDQGGETFYVQAQAGRSPPLASGYPGTREQLFAYDAIVLANLESAVLTGDQLEATRDFVGRRGGGLLVLGAQSFLRRGLGETPLEDVLPLDLADRGGAVRQASAGPAGAANRVALTSAGESHPIMQLMPGLEATRKRWEAVPALASVSPLGGPRPGASVLAVTSAPGGAARALVAVQRYGAGRSMMFTGEAAWRWRMMLPSDDRSYDTFWRQAVRWLALPATDPVSLSAPPASAPGDLVSWRVSVRDARFETLRDASVELRIIRPDGRVESIAAAIDTSSGSDGSFLARHRPDEAGVYRATAGVKRSGASPVTATASLLVGGADMEMTDPRLNRQVLERLAMSSGGRMIESGEARALAGELRAAAPAAVLLGRKDLWHNGWIFAFIVALLALEWGLRRKWGLR